MKCNTALGNYYKHLCNVSNFADSTQICTFSVMLIKRICIKHINIVDTAKVLWFEHSALICT